MFLLSRLTRKKSENYDLLTTAINLATEYHAGQYRKHAGPAAIRLPYIMHPIQVAKVLWQWGIGDEQTLCAAICHDLIEDTKIPSGLITSKLSFAIEHIVQELSFIHTGGGDRKTAKANYMETFVTKSIEALAIKAADRFCNVEDYTLSHPDYAAPYFYKASTVFDCCFRTRKDELNKKFGAQVSSRMRVTYDAITEKLKYAELARQIQ
jgi:(p)ppGpp synthase/HD superfamily hydrolase